MNTKTDRFVTNIEGREIEKKNKKILVKYLISIAFQNFLYNS